MHKKKDENIKKRYKFNYAKRAPRKLFVGSFRFFAIAISIHSVRSNAFDNISHFTVILHIRQKCWINLRICLCIFISFVSYLPIIEFSIFSLRYRRAFVFVLPRELWFFMIISSFDYSASIWEALPLFLRSTILKIDLIVNLFSFHSIQLLHLK